MALPTRVVLSGNQAFLRTAIMESINEYYNLKNLEVQAEGGGGSHRPLPSYVKGKMYLKLYFSGIIANTTAPHVVEKSFRLMKIDPTTVSLEALKALGQKTYTKFNNFSFQTGHESYTYNDPENGFNRIWGYFPNQTEAMKLYEAMLDLISVSPDWKRLTNSRVVQPGNRFSEPPDKVIQANVSVRSDRERPVSTQKFAKANIKFPHLRKETPLINEFGLILNSLDFLREEPENPQATAS